MNRKFINIQPSELKFPFQLNKLSTCWLELSSKTDINVAFKVKTTHPKKYCVRPNSGLISPGSSCVVKVSMQAQKDYPAPLPKDKFLVLSMIAPVGMNAEDITSEMFRKEKGYDVEELKLKVVFVTADPPSPIAEVSEEELSPEAHELQKSERDNYIMDLFDAATISIGESEDQFFKESNANREDEEELFLAAESSFESERKLAQEWDRVSKLIEERSFIKLENQELQYEAEMIRKRIYRSSSNHGVILFVVLACFLGIVVGYVIR